jgi:hypothetical protein
MQTYMIVGAGGTGTHLLPSLLAYLKNHHAQAESEYQVVIADGDTYDTKNLTRQLFDEGLVTLNKADAMVTMYAGHPIVAVTRYIGAEDISAMVKDGDCIFICADNYSVRRLLIDHVKDLNNVVLINGGNELFSGSVQLWIREKGKNVTPPPTYGHPEITFIAADDRAAMDCRVAATLPGGEQTIMANMTTAAYMLTAVQRWHSGAFKTKGSGAGWTELQFDLREGFVEHIDMRERKNWARNPA